MLLAYFRKSHTPFSTKSCFAMASFADDSTQAWNLDATASSNFPGATRTNLRMWDYYQPSVIDFTGELWAARKSQVDPDPAIPLPEGWWLMMAGQASASGCFRKNFFDPKHVSWKTASFTDRHTFRETLSGCFSDALSSPNRRSQRGRSRPRSAKW